jgi:pimeloyl-ACP methyl ester carboxylesterase
LLVRMAVAAVAVAPLCVVASASAETGPDGGWKPPDQLEWVPCAEGSAGECATMQVPVDWSDPGGDSLDLTFGRLRASDPAQRIGTLFLPSSRGINTYIINRSFRDTDRMLTRFDIVSWDWRGNGRSTPVRCSPAVLKGDDYEASPFPDTEDLFTQRASDNTARAVDCLKQSGPVLNHMDASSTARDMDAIRAALDEPRLTYFGSALASVPAQRYAELFPNRVRALVLDTAWDHSHTSTAGFFEDLTIAQEASFEEFDAWCDRTATCPLREEGVRETFERLYAAAQAGQLVNPTTGAVVTAQRLLFVLVNNLYFVQQGWPLTVQDFANLLTWLDPAASQPSAGAAPAAEPAQQPPLEELAQHTFQGWECEDFRYRVNGPAQLSGYRERMAELAPHTRILFSLAARRAIQCIGWPLEASYPQRRGSITGIPPVLVVAARHDMSVPFAWARSVVSQIDRAVMLEYDGYGFGHYANSGPCIREHVQNYLFTGRPPAPGTHCPAVFPGQPTAAAQVPDPALDLGVPGVAGPISLVG